MIQKMSEHYFEKKLIDLRAEIDLPVNIRWLRYGTPEYWNQLEKELEWEAKDLMEFIRDHRSRDHYGINIVKEYGMICKFCGQEYPIDFDGIAICCDKIIEAQKVRIEDI